MSTPPPDSRPCPNCGEALHRGRGVCPACGHMSTWFKVRLYGGCAGILLALLAIGLFLLQRLYFPGPAG